MKIKDETGVEIEVFTAKEVEEKTSIVTKEAAEKASKEAVEKYQKDHPDQSSELAKIQNNLAELTKKLSEEENKGGNENENQIQRLKKDKEDAEKALLATETKIMGEINKFKNEFIGDFKTEMLDKLSGGDDEVRKKIEYEFDNYKPNDLSKLGIQERLIKAHTLATGEKPSPRIFDGGILNGGQKGDGYKEKDQPKLSDNAIAIGNQLGITEEDRKKFGPK